MKESSRGEGASSFLHVDGAVGGLVGRGGRSPGLVGLQEGGVGGAAGADLALRRAGAGRAEARGRGGADRAVEGELGWAGGTACRRGEGGSLGDGGGFGNGDGAGCGGAALGGGARFLFLLGAPPEGSGLGGGGWWGQKRTARTRGGA